MKPPPPPGPHHNSYFYSHSSSYSAGVNDIPGAKKAMKGVGETVGTGVNAVDDAGEATWLSPSGRREYSCVEAGMDLVVTELSLRSLAAARRVAVSKILDEVIKLGVVIFSRFSPLGKRDAIAALQVFFNTDKLSVLVVCTEDTKYLHDQTSSYCVELTAEQSVTSDISRTSENNKSPSLRGNFSMRLREQLSCLRLQIQNIVCTA